MPMIDIDDSLSWPIGWEPDFISVARREGERAYWDGWEVAQNPFSPSTRSWRAWNTGYDAAAFLDQDGLTVQEAGYVL